MELKTLKDLEREEIVGDGVSRGLDFVFIKELKAEAAKWANNMEKGRKAFMEFFDLTEEDIQGQDIRPHDKDGKLNSAPETEEDLKDEYK